MGTLMSRLRSLFHPSCFPLSDLLYAVPKLLQQAQEETTKLKEQLMKLEVPH